MIRFKNGYYITLRHKDIELRKGEVWTNRDKIIFVGEPSEKLLKTGWFDREIDLDGNLIMPSFKNAHTHSAMTFLRSYADDLPLQEWLFDKGEELPCA